MNIVNLTKNTINVYAGEAFKAIPSSGEARIKSTRVFGRLMVYHYTESNIRLLLVFPPKLKIPFLWCLLL